MELKGEGNGRKASLTSSKWKQQTPQNLISIRDEVHTDANLLWKPLYSVPSSNLSKSSRKRFDNELAHSTFLIPATVVVWDFLLGKFIRDDQSGSLFNWALFTIQQNSNIIASS
jgi:hypothetical protein